MLTLLSGNPVEYLYDKFTFFGLDLYKFNKAIGLISQDGTPLAGGMFLITKHVVVIFIATFLIIAAFMWARFRSGSTAGGAPRGLRNFLEPILMFIRDEIVRPSIKDPHHDHGHGHGDAHGHDAHAHGEHKETHKLADTLLPYFCTLFFFIATINLLGLIPGSSTPTAAITATGALAATVLVIMVIGGLFVQKPIIWGFIKNFVPKVPLPLYVILIPVEILSLFAKPFALTVRLFANMNAGHIIILSLSGLAVMAVNGMGYIGAGVGLVAGLGCVAIYCLEVFVSILQAYIFTYLAAIFIGAYLVPEH